MITETQVSWAEIVLDSGYGNPAEVRNAMEIIREFKEQCEAEKARVGRLMQEEKQS